MGRRRPFLAVAAVALVAAVAGTSALSSRSENAADQPSGPSAHPAVAAQGTDAGAVESADDTSSGAPGSAATPPVDDSSATVTHRAHRPSPARIMRAHFEHIGNGELLAAFRLFVPSYRSRNPRWPTTRGAAVARTNVVTIGTPRYHGGGIADVPVNVFTRDTVKVPDSDTLCRQFTGIARVRLVGRGWRYDPLARPLHGSVRKGNRNCP